MAEYNSCESCVNRTDVFPDEQLCGECWQTPWDGSTIPGWDADPIH